MHRDELLAEITRAFPAAPHPAEATLLPPAAEASEAARSSQAAFSGQAWLALPDSVLREQPASLTLLSPVGLRYYLPAFLCFALREPGAHGPELLLKLLKLPIELNGPAATELLAYFEAGSPPPAAAISSLMQQQLSQTNQALNRFITWASPLTPPQAKAIRHFLLYFRDVDGPAAGQQEAAVAIERYWFQFA